MDNYKWNREQISNEFPACTDLNQVINAMEVHIAKNGQVICEVKVNNLPLTEEDEARLGPSKVDEIDFIEVNASPLKELVDESMATVLQIVPTVKELALATADSLRSNKEAQALLLETFDACQLLTEALAHLKPFIVENNESLLGDRWLVNESQYANCIRELLEALEKNDWVRLGDSLEYELTTSLELWLELLVSED